MIGEAEKPRNRMSGWNMLPDVSFTLALGVVSRMAPVSVGMPVRAICLLSSTWVASGSTARSIPDPNSGVEATTSTSGIVTAGLV